MARAEEQGRGSSLCCNFNYLVAILLLKICSLVTRREENAFARWAKEIAAF
jgi:hypothetical protein